MDLARCDEIGYRQDGLIVRRQALEVLSERQITYLLQQGVWHQIYPGAYRMTGVADTWMRRVRAATLLRPDVRVSHHAAAFLLDLIDRQPSTIEVLAPMTSSARLPKVAVRRTRTWPMHDTFTVHGIPSTCVARTIVDIVPRSSIRTIQRAVDHAITKHHCAVDDIYSVVEYTGTRGRKNIRLLLDLLPKRAGQLERAESIEEINILDWIREANLPIPTAQFCIPVGSGSSFRIDFAYPDLKVAIEVQSWRWHGGPAQHEKDASRTITLAAMGWIVLPVLRRQENRAPFLAALRNTLISRR